MFPRLCHIGRARQAAAARAALQRTMGFAGVMAETEPCPSWKAERHPHDEVVDPRVPGAGHGLAFLRSHGDTGRVEGWAKGSLAQDRSLECDDLLRGTRPAQEV